MQVKGKYTLIEINYDEDDSAATPAAPSKAPAAAGVRAQPSRAADGTMHACALRTSDIAAALCRQRCIAASGAQTTNAARAAQHCCAPMRHGCAAHRAGRRCCDVLTHCSDAGVEAAEGDGVPRRADLQPADDAAAHDGDRVSGRGLERERV
jgi:hypothetical protein